MRQNTSNASKWLAETDPKNPYKEGRLGVIVEGAYVDLILVNGAPTKDVSVLLDFENNIPFVMKNAEETKNSLE